ncbi:MAG: hypothetical protein WCJ02_08220 [bacterium]
MSDNLAENLLPMLSWMNVLDEEDKVAYSARHAMALTPLFRNTREDVKIQYLLKFRPERPSSIV